MSDDKPLFATGPVHKLELKAIQSYRKKYPDGVPWHELSGTTRTMWVAHAERPPQTEQKEPTE